MKLNRPILDEYLDGQLASSQVAAVDQELRTNPSATQLVAQMRRERALRQAAFKGFEPSAAEAAHFAARCLAEFKDAQHAPIARIGPRTILRWSGAIAAGLILMIGCFMAGRTSVTTPAPVAVIKYMGPNTNGDLAEYTSPEELKNAWDKYVAAVQLQNNVQVADADTIPDHGNF